MTEAEWMACDDPKHRLESLRGQVSDRKLRLFAVACCRGVWELLIDKRSRLAVRKLEDYADDPTNGRLLRDAYNIAKPACNDLYSAQPGPTWSAAHVVLAATTPLGPPDFRDQQQALGRLFGGLDGNLRNALQGEWQGVHRMEVDIIREILGNPFRPVAFDPEWRTDTALALARQMYDSRDFGTMPILADALQEAGCDSADILDHCRGPGPHVRGCWVVDLVLGKE